MCVLCTVYTVKSLWFISVAPVVVAGISWSWEGSCDDGDLHVTSLLTLGFLQLGGIFNKIRTLLYILYLILTEYSKE